MPMPPPPPFIMGKGPGPPCISSRRAAVSEFVRDSLCSWPRATFPYLLEVNDMRGSSIMLVCVAGAPPSMIWLERFLPKLGRKRLFLGGPPPRNQSRPLRIWAALGGGPLRFFLDVTLGGAGGAGAGGGGGPAAAGAGE